MGIYLCVSDGHQVWNRILLKEMVYRFNHLPSWGWLFWVIDWHWMATRWWWRDCEMIEKKFDFLCICFWQSGFQCQSTLVRLFYDMMMMVMHWFFKEISSTNNITLLYNIVVVVVRLETFQKRNTKRKRVERNRDPATTSSTGKKWRRKSNKRKERKKERKQNKQNIKKLFLFKTAIAYRFHFIRTAGRIISSLSRRSISCRHVAHQLYNISQTSSSSWLGWWV